MERWKGITYYSSIDEIPVKNEVSFMCEYIKLSYQSNNIHKLSSKFSKLKLMISEGKNEDAIIEVNNMITAYNDVLEKKNNIIDCFKHLVVEFQGSSKLEDIEEGLKKVPYLQLYKKASEVKKKLMLKVN